MEANNKTKTIINITNASNSTKIDFNFRYLNVAMNRVICIVVKRKESNNFNLNESRDFFLNSSFIIHLIEIKINRSIIKYAATKKYNSKK